jgi:competence protein ComEA
MSDEGRIDIKLADATLLETLPRIGPTYAQRIVAYREMNGPFETIEKNQDVQGSGPATLEKIRAQITFREHP